MTSVSNGNTVTLHYVGTLPDGTEFDNSRTRQEPITVVIGSGQLIPGFNDALVGMSVSETKSFTLTPDNAYGDRVEDRTTSLSKTVFPEDFVFQEGMQIPLQGPEGPVISTLLEVNDSEVVLDLNHPMAGKTLNFEVEVLNIEDTDG
tara:strand:+ start:2117 stop:2557 length:441 start_codon:yes stop_codon:yes gene_type:complete